MSVQVLIASMNQMDHSLLDKMNIQSDAIVANQCDYNSIEDFTWNGHQIRYLNFSEIGVGLNRNNSLMRASGDICLFADDDLRYVDGYVDRIEQAFCDLPDADVIVFNIKGRDSGRSLIKKRTRVGRFNYLRYGTARIAIKLSSIKRNGIYFNQCFGGGTEHCHGEDNIFLSSCLNKHLKIYAEPIMLAVLEEDRVSTWNDGDIDKYIIDQGCLFKTISPHFWLFLCLQDCIRRTKSFYLRPWYITFYKMIQGALNEI